MILLVYCVYTYMQKKAAEERQIISEQAAIIYEKETLEREIQEEEQRRLQAEIEVQKLKKIQEERAKTDRFNIEIRDSIELVLLTECGDIQVSDDKTSANNWWSDWLINSEMVIYAKYELIATIPTAYIFCYFNETGVVQIKYDPTRIRIKSVEITNMSTQSTKALLGRGYSPEEITSLILVMKDYVYSSANKDAVLFNKAEENLRQYIGVLLEEFRIENYIIENN